MEALSTWVCFTTATGNWAPAGKPQAHTGSESARLRGQDGIAKGKLKQHEDPSKDFQNHSPNRKDQHIPYLGRWPPVVPQPDYMEMARNHMGTQAPWIKAHGYLRLKVRYRHPLAQVGLDKELVWQVSHPDQRAQGQLVPLHPAAMTHQPVGHPGHTSSWRPGEARAKARSLCGC